MHRIYWAVFLCICVGLFSCSGASPPVESSEALSDHAKYGISRLGGVELTEAEALELVEVSVDVASLQKGYEFLRDEVSLEIFEESDPDLPMYWMRDLVGAGITDLVNFKSVYSYAAGTIKSDETGGHEDFYAFAVPLMPLRGRQRLAMGCFDLVHKDERTATYRPKIGVPSGMTGEMGDGIHCNVKILEKNYLVCSSHVSIVDALDDHLVRKLKRPTSAIAEIVMDGDLFKDTVAAPLVREYLSFAKKTMEMGKISDAVLEDLDRVLVRLAYRGNRVHISSRMEWREENETLAKLMASGATAKRGPRVPDLPADSVSSVVVEHVDLESLSRLLGPLDMAGELLFDGGRISSTVEDALEDGYADGDTTESLFLAFGNDGRELGRVLGGSVGDLGGERARAAMLGWFVLGVEGSMDRLRETLEQEIGYEGSVKNGTAPVSMDEAYSESATLVPIAKKERLPDGSVHLAISRETNRDEGSKSTRDEFSSNETHVYFLDSGEGVWVVVAAAEAEARRVARHITDKKKGKKGKKGEKEPVAQSGGGFKLEGTLSPSRIGAASMPMGTLAEIEAAQKMLGKRKSSLAGSIGLKVARRESGGRGLVVDLDVTVPLSALKVFSRSSREDVRSLSPEMREKYEKRKVEELAPLLKSTDLEERLYAVIGLGRMKLARARVLLETHLLAEKDVDVRMMTAMSLLKHKSVKSISALKQAHTQAFNSEEKALLLDVIWIIRAHNRESKRH